MSAFLKTCTQCREAKPAVEFHRSGMTDDGLRHACKLCDSAAYTAAGRTALVPTRMCRGCHRHKGLAEFSSTADKGMEAWCVDCHAQLRSRLQRATEVYSEQCN